jgi:hypothetical protein
MGDYSAPRNCLDSGGRLKVAKMTEHLGLVFATCHGIPQGALPCSRLSHASGSLVRYP